MPRPCAVCGVSDDLPRTVVGIPAPGEPDSLTHLPPAEMIALGLEPVECPPVRLVAKKEN